MKKLLLILILTNISFAQTNKSDIIKKLEKAITIQNLYYADKDTISKNLKNAVSQNDLLKLLDGSKYLLYNKYKPDSLYFIFKENKLVENRWFFSNNNLTNKSLQQQLEKEFGRSGVSMNNKRSEYFWEDNYSKLGIITKVDSPQYFELNFSFNMERKLIDEPLESIRIGKGSSKFIPDINNTLLILQKPSSKKTLEDLLPEFKVEDKFETTYRYNEKTNEHDLLDEEVSKYSFMYKSDYMVFLKVYTKKNIITKMEYSFDQKQNLDKLKTQILSNGFTLDLKLSKIISKMGYNDCFVFTKKLNYNFTIYSEKRYSLSK